MLEGLLIDSRGHHPGCPKHGKDEPPTADETTGYVDLFCDCHAFDTPMILKNGTDVAWPSGWEEDHAATWRKENGLARPGNPDSA